MLCQGEEHLFDHSGAHPVLEASVRSLVWAIPGWQVLPRCSGAQYPLDGVEDFASVAPRTSASVLPDRIGRQDGLDEIPLFVCQIHP